ncbi:mechanosensitive ion channel family protein [Flavobacterium weaverense]|uniref:Mechanosensitive ion channel-like protein n=1 Tax=Flavobacterium weaverense TaxID=271156 RepID=A0A3L9ZLD8_9FLAO|nr:mechanosensitive ion channel domain-containing protein [Flavobacterium weaverense]RMA72977.1 mechanosensitive ion channel-like protein [Flavobacterium weaverense]
MKEFLKYTLFTFDGFSLQVLAIVKLILWLFMVGILLKTIKSIVYRTSRFDDAKKFSIYTLSKYVIIVFSFMIGLHLIGLDVSLLLAGSAALLVGFGLGMQNLFSDYISGLIILIDSSIKVGDVLEIKGLVCKVQQIKLRTTTVLTRDDKWIILPNTDLTRNQLINWTHSDTTSRFSVSTRVDFSSDVDLVMSIMEQTAQNFDKIRLEPKPIIRFEEFAESSLNFTIHFWSDDVFRIENIKSEYRVLLLKAFNKENIVIPYPQRVIHSSINSQFTTE